MFIYLVQIIISPSYKISYIQYCIASRGNGAIILLLYVNTHIYIYTLYIYCTYTLDEYLSYRSSRCTMTPSVYTIFTHTHTHTHSHVFRAFPVSRLRDSESERVSKETRRADIVSPVVVRKNSNLLRHLLLLLLFFIFFYTTSLQVVVYF